MGWRQAAVVASLVIVQGKNEGVFSYSPSVGFGNLVASTGIATAGTDRFGNAYLAGDTVYSLTGGLTALNTNAGQLALYTAATEAGPWTLRAVAGLFRISPASFFAVEQGGFALGNAPTEFWLPPSGDTTGATDTAAISAIFGIGFPVVVHLLPGAYFVNNTIVVPTGCALIGSFPVQADNETTYGASGLPVQGTIIQASAAFTAGPFPSAVIACSNTTATQQGAQVIANLSIQANGTPAGSGVAGILLHGAVGAGIIQGVTVNRPDGPCLKVETDGGTGFWPIQWKISDCVFAASRSSHGVQIQNLTDSTFTNCLAHDCTLDGWNINGCAADIFTACRGDTNHQNGFHFTGFISPAEGVQMVGCNTQLNQKSGYLFDASASVRASTYQLNGCQSTSDGQAAAGILAGFYDQGSKSRIMLDGCAAFPNGTGPAYGAYEGSVAFGMALAGCFMQGITAATHDDGTNTNVLSNLVPVPF